MKTYCLYKRISSRKQLASGLSLEAQHKLALDYIEANGGVIAGEFTEQETASGKKRRPQLQKALALCKKNKATLMVANLTRLSRSVYFTSMLLKDNVDFVCLDMPNVDKPMIQMMSIMAEWEVDQCSKRTKLALAAARARGVKLGVNGKNLGKLNEKAATAYYQGIKQDVIVSLGKTRKRTLQHYADTLNRSGIQTRCYGKWYPQTVKNMFKHLNWDTKAPSFT